MVKFMVKFSFSHALFICLVVLTPQLSYAYIDPGTGATFVGSLAPLLVGLFTGAAAFVIKYFWDPIKRASVRVLGKKAE